MSGQTENTGQPESIGQDAGVTNYGLFTSPTALQLHYVCMQINSTLQQTCYNAFSLVFMVQVMGHSLREGIYDSHHRDREAFTN